MNCIFCKIATEKQNAFLYEDDDILAFEDIAPQAPTHLLIIPKRHISTLNDTTEKDKALLGHMMFVATQLAQQHGISEPGYRLVFNCNREGGQAVYHIHLHLLGGRPMTWPPG